MYLGCRCLHVPLQHRQGGGYKGERHAWGQGRGSSGDAVKQAADFRRLCNEKPLEGLK